jgi:hypothetical protein
VVGFEVGVLLGLAPVVVGSGACEAGPVGGGTGGRCVGFPVLVPVTVSDGVGEGTVVTREVLNGGVSTGCESSDLTAPTR